MSEVCRLLLLTSTKYSCELGKLCTCKCCVPAWVTRLLEVHCIIINILSMQAQTLSAPFKRDWAGLVLVLQFDCSLEAGSSCCAVMFHSICLILWLSLLTDISVLMTCDCFEFCIAPWNGMSRAGALSKRPGLSFHPTLSLVMQLSYVIVLFVL